MKWLPYIKKKKINEIVTRFLFEKTAPRPSCVVRATRDALVALQVEDSDAFLCKWNI